MKIVRRLERGFDVPRLWYGFGIQAYCVACGEFLFCADYGTRTLGFVQSSISTDDSLVLRGASAGFAPNLGDSVPVVHGDGSGGKGMSVMLQKGIKRFWRSSLAISMDGCMSGADV